MTKLLVTFVVLTCSAALIGCHKKNRGGGGGIFPRGSTSVAAPIPTAPPAPNVPPPAPSASPVSEPISPATPPSPWSAPSSASDSSRSTSPETPIWIDQERDES